MYTKSQLAFKYLRYLAGSSSGRGHGIHSPFIYDFVAHVLHDHKEYAEYAALEKGRRQLLSEKDVVEVEDFGAGSAIHKSHRRSISSVAQHAAKSRKWARLLFRMVRKYQPATVIELGTSLGITAAHLAMGSPAANVITLEGAPALAARARAYFNELSISNSTIVEGPFDTMLPKVLEGADHIDLAFIDGNHQQAATLDYFHQFLYKTGNDSILLFDDIHWSEGMEKAWDAIRQHEAVRCTVDLFFMGIVLFRQEFRARQHFIIRF